MYPLISPEQLHTIMPNARQRVELFAGHLNTAMVEFNVTTPLQVAAFISQIAHESGEFLYVKELATGIAYEGRLDLGNTQRGDGRLFKGRGLIQLTGRSNYVALMMALDIDCVNHPELVELPENACRSACWFWGTNNLNKWADIPDFDGVCDMVNRGHKTIAVGDSNGYQSRLKYYQAAKKALGIN